MKQESAESGDVDILSGRNMLEVLEALRGCIVFVETLLATHVNFRKGCNSNGLSVPKWFVDDNRKSLDSDDVVLLTNKGAWKLTFSINQQFDGVPLVTFSGGWEAFGVSNNLTEGNHLLFNLSGMSRFHVYIFNADGTQKAAVPLPISKGLSGDGSVCGLSTDDEETSCQLPKEQGKIDADRDHAPSIPYPSSFIKRLTRTNLGSSTHVSALEMPAGFTRTHGGQLRTLVTLQGISPESPAYTLCCNWTQEGTTKFLRLFLRYGWIEFWKANDLKVGQVLEFTLKSDSYFVVRKIAG